MDFIKVEATMIESYQKSFVSRSAAALAQKDYQKSIQYRAAGIFFGVFVNGALIGIMLSSAVPLPPLLSFAVMVTALSLSTLAAVVCMKRCQRLSESADLEERAEHIFAELDETNEQRTQYSA